MATQVAPSPMQAAMIKASNVPNSSRTAYSVGAHRLRYISADNSKAADVKFLHLLRQACLETSDQTVRAVNCRALCWVAAGRWQRAYRAVPAALCRRG